MPSRFLLALIAMIISASSVSAQLDPQSKTPYLWRVVLRTQPHPLLSQTLREQVRRDLEAALAPTLGALGTVEVIDLATYPRDRWDPLWQQFDDKGFAALETPRDLSVTKTHFLKLEYRDGQYQLEARQHDGFSGLASGYAGYGAPVIRKQSVRVAAVVGRTAGLMLERDFGLDGTVELLPTNPKIVNVLVRGGQLGPLERFVKPGDVFTVSDVSVIDRKAPVVRTATGKIIEPPAGAKVAPGLASRLRSNPVLKVSEVGSDGVIKCEVLGRPLPPPQGKVAGYRCMKLGTIDSPLAVRLVSPEGNSSKTSRLVSVRASEKGFSDSGNARDMLVEDPHDGLLHSGRPLANIACITVTLGPTQSKQFPVPILGADPVNLTVQLDPDAEARAVFDKAAVSLDKDALDARNAQDVCFNATGKLMDKAKNAEALQRARGGYQAAKLAIQEIGEELKHLRESQERGNYSPRILARIQQRVATIELINKELEKLIDTLDKVVARENDPSIGAREIQLQTLNERIKILIGRGEIDEALLAYDQLMSAAKDDAALTTSIKTAREKLAQEWATRGEAHVAARQYLLKTWPAVSTIADLKDSLPQLGKEIDECKKQNDRHTLRRLLVIFGGVAAKLQEQVAGLDPNSDADQKLAKEANAAGEALAAKEQEIRDFIGK